MEAFFESIGRRGDTFNLVEYVKGENLQEFDDNGVDYNQLFNTTNRDPSCRFSAPEDGQYWVMISDRYQRGGAVCFFSSRRRHTRWNCDWSSDVCSSDLKWRSQTIGFVFQSFNLIPVLTAAQNVELPLLLTSLSRAERAEHVATALRIVGLEDRMHHYPRQLSGGQEQRVAIARAIVNDPKIIVADEPTGDLDRKSADDVLTLMERLNKEMKKTIFMVTHDPAAAERASVQRKLDKGALQ